MERVKIYIDEGKGFYGINDADETHLVAPIFSTEKKAREYVKAMGWVLADDDFKDRYNNLMVTIKTMYSDFIAGVGLEPNYILLSEYTYNTILLSDGGIKRGTTPDGKETQSIFGMSILVDRGNWKPRIMLGILR